MTIALNNINLSISRLNFNITKEGNQLKYNVDCVLSEYVDIEELSFNLLKDFDGSFTIIGLHTYEFEDYQFSTIEIYEENNISNIIIRFIK